jgi:hypothetical protein
MYAWLVNPVACLAFAVASDRCNSFHKGIVGALWVCYAFHSVAITLNADHDLVMPLCHPIPRQMAAYC